jgi:outer membrane murein-binding lipoprotein Lpp
MKASAVGSVLCIVIACSACTQRGYDEQLSTRVQTLESDVAALQRRADDLALKNQITSSLLFRSPLEDFFQSPEFWENTYDSGQADCAKRCIAELQTHRQACLQLPENQRLACFQEATDRASRCQTQCSRL